MWKKILGFILKIIAGGSSSDDTVGREAAFKNTKVLKAETKKVNGDKMAELRAEFTQDMNNGLEGLADGVVGMFKEHGEELAKVGQEYAKKLTKAGASVIKGDLTWEQFEEISDNYWNAARSKLLSEGLKAKAEVMDSIISSATSLLGVGIKALIALI